MTLTLPRRRSVDKSLSTCPATETVLRDLAFVLKMTERVRDDILAGADVPRECLGGDVANA